MTSSYQSTAFQSSARPVDTFVAEPSVLPKTGMMELAETLQAINPALQQFIGQKIQDRVDAEKIKFQNIAIQEDLLSGMFGNIVTETRKQEGKDAADQLIGASRHGKKAYAKQKTINSTFKINNLIQQRYATDKIDITNDDGSISNVPLTQVSPDQPEFNTWFQGVISPVVNNISKDTDPEILNKFFLPQLQKSITDLDTTARKQFNLFNKNKLLAESTDTIKESAKFFLKAQTYNFKNPNAKKMMEADLKESLSNLIVDYKNAGITGNDLTALNETIIDNIVNIGELAVTQGNFDYAAQLVNFLGDSIPGSSQGKTLKDNPKWTDKTTDFFFDLYVKEGEIKERDYKLEKINRRNRFTTRIEDYRNEKDPILKNQKYEKLKLDFQEKEYQTDIDEFGVLDNKPFNEKINKLLKDITRGVYFVDGEPDKGSAYLELDKIEKDNLTPDSETEAQITKVNNAIKEMKSYTNDLSKYEDDIMQEVKQKLKQPSGPFRIPGLSNKDAALVSRYQRILQDEADEAMADFVKENNRPMTKLEIKKMYRRLEDYLFLEVGIINDDEIQTIPEVDAIGVDINPFSTAKRKEKKQNQQNLQNNEILKDDSFDIPQLKSQASNNQTTSEIVSDMTPTGLGAEDGALIAMARTNQNINKETEVIEKEPEILKTGDGVKRMEFNFPIIYNLAKEVGIKFPEVVAAQFGLESSHGAKESGKNNFLGIKATQKEIADGKATLVKTKEVIDGKEVIVDDYFKDFNSVKDMLLHYKQQWNDDFGDRKGTINVNTAEEAVKRLKDNKYATDPDYVKKIMSVIKSAKTNPPLF